MTKGYVSLDDLRVFIQPWQVECGYRDAEVKADFTMTGENTGETVTVKKGTVLTASAAYPVCSLLRILR